MVVTVVMQNTTRSYDKFYDYAVPKHLEAYVQPGCRVLVPFGKGERFREAFVMDVKSESRFNELKEISQMIDETPVLTQELIQLSQMMKKRYTCTYDLAIRCMIPAGLALQFSHEVVLKKDFASDETAISETISSPTTGGEIITSETISSPIKAAEIIASPTKATETIASPANTSEIIKDESISNPTKEGETISSSISTGEITTDCGTNDRLAKPASDAAFNEITRNATPISALDAAFNGITSDELEIVTILKNNSGCLSIKRLQEKYNKPVMRVLKKLESRNIIGFVNNFQMKAKAKTIKVAIPAIDNEEYQELTANNQIRNIKTMRLMEMLYEEGEIAVNELNMLGFSYAVLKNMEKKGYVSFIEEPVERNPLDEVDVQKTEPMPPTPCQREALSCIFEVLAEENFREILLHGVTGSGKTEVYLQVIQAVLQKGKTAIMLVPEIGLTPQTVQQFKGRFGERVAVLHSRLSIGERFDQWNKIKSGEIQIVVGARSAVFAPLSNIGIIIIDEEHETSYKSDRTPKYDARTIAAARCRFHNGLVLYGSATPSVENYWRAATGRIKLVEMLQRTNSRPLPEVITVDMRSEMSQGNRDEFSRTLISEIQKNKEAGEQTLLFINRRGHSNYVLCRDCGFMAICPFCSVSLTWHQSEKRLVCHYCSYATVKPQKCPKCNSDKLEPCGLGTQKVEGMIPAIDKGLSVIRMDYDTTGGKRGHQKILDAFRTQKTDVMVGTQMIAKGHDFPDVTLVGILSADGLLGSGDFRAAERTFQLITQASGRAGRAQKQGRVVLQTFNPDEFSIQAAIRQDYKAFFEQEIALRRQLQLPPFYQFGLIQVSGKDKELVQRIIQKIHSELMSNEAIHSGIFLSEPAPSPVAKLRNLFRWRIILKHPSTKTLQTVLEWVHDIYSHTGKKGYSVSVDINPVSMI